MQSWNTGQSLRINSGNGGPRFNWGNSGGGYNSARQPYGGMSAGQGPTGQMSDQPYDNGDPLGAPDWSRNGPQGGRLLLGGENESGASQEAAPSWLKELLRMGMLWNRSGAQGGRLL